MLTVSLGKSPLIWSICPLVFWQKNSRFLWTIKENRFFFSLSEFCRGPRERSRICFVFFQWTCSRSSTVTRHWRMSLSERSLWFCFNEWSCDSDHPPTVGFSFGGRCLTPPLRCHRNTLCQRWSQGIWETLFFPSLGGGGGGGGGAFWLAGEGVCWPPDAARGRRVSRARWW